jgi:hypothetical protein
MTFLKKILFISPYLILSLTIAYAQETALNFDGFILDSPKVCGDFAYFGTFSSKGEMAVKLRKVNLSTSEVQDLPISVSNVKNSFGCDTAKNHFYTVSGQRSSLITSYSLDTPTQIRWTLNLDESFSKPILKNIEFTENLIIASVSSYVSFRDGFDRLHDLIAVQKETGKIIWRKFLEKDDSFSISENKLFLIQNHQIKIFDLKAIEDGS